MLGILVAILAAVGAALAVYLLDMPAATLLSVGAGALCLLWLVALLTWPWNTYFQARALIQEIRTSRMRGIEVPVDREAEARRIAGRMRWVAIGAHLVSAVVLAIVTWLAGAELGYWFAAFYLLSTFFRPAAAYFGYLRERMRTMLREVRYPRDDLRDLLDTVGQLTARADALEERADDAATARRDASAHVAELESRTTERIAAAERTQVAMARQFEHSLSRLTDNHEVMAGLKAFLRLVRAEPS